jgi:hypothetical protein
MTRLTDRQLAITLASLRYIQGHLYESPMFAAEHLYSSDPIVKPEEIDEICDLVNDPGFYGFVGILEAPRQVTAGELIEFAITNGMFDDLAIEADEEHF